MLKKIFVVTALIIILLGGVFLRKLLVCGQPTRSELDKDYYTVFYGCFGKLKDSKCYGVEQICGKYEIWE